MKCLKQKKKHAGMVQIDREGSSKSNTKNHDNID